MGEIASMLILWVVVIGLMWFLLMRPQKKEHLSLARKGRPQIGGKYSRP